MQVLNRKEQSAKFNFTKQFPYYKEVFHKPDFKGRKLGKNVVFDMDMSAGDFLALFYLLKLPVEVINLKVVKINPFLKFFICSDKLFLEFYNLSTHILGLFLCRQL